MAHSNLHIQGAGVGLRRSVIDEMLTLETSDADFMEVAPENWIGIGGRFGKRFERACEKFPMMCHGLSLSLGSPSELDFNFLKDLKHFLDKHNVVGYSEHLSYCSDHGHLYDLMPIPFTEESVKYVADRIRKVQDAIERPLIIENVSYYAAPHQQMSELDFLLAVLSEADCGLLLDVNNVFVNSINHKYDAKEFINQIPKERIDYMHIAGHYDEADDLKVDTHGASVKNDVWDLLAHTYQKFGVIPTLLERDFNIPPVPELMKEVEQIKAIQAEYALPSQTVARAAEYNIPGLTQVAVPGEESANAQNF